LRALAALALLTAVGLPPAFADEATPPTPAASDASAPADIARNCAPDAACNPASDTAAASTDQCPADDALRAPDLYGEWSVELPALGLRGHLTLKQHPEFTDSLRGLFDYGTVHSIASGDIEEGDFDLDESRDGKSLYAFWTGHVQPGTCGHEIRGKWERAPLDDAPATDGGTGTTTPPSQSSPFILRRIGP
jgi:hypothetical protein